MKKIYVCENNITGILSAIYDAWKESRDADAGIEIRGFMEPRMFCE
ncbi:MAG: DNA metabolism protein, partial [Lachnospiraceae bacterium]|nr:DNA metabolism protein [Lachnospiraceae bacterium]